MAHALVRRWGSRKSCVSPEVRWHCLHNCFMGSESLHLEAEPGDDLLAMLEKSLGPKGFTRFGSDKPTWHGKFTQFSCCVYVNKHEQSLTSGTMRKWQAPCIAITISFLCHVSITTASPSRSLETGSGKFRLNNRMC